MYLLVVLLCLQPPSPSIDQNRKVSLTGRVSLDPFTVQLLDRDDVRRYVGLEPWQIEQIDFARAHYLQNGKELQKLLERAIKEPQLHLVHMERSKNTKDSYLKDLAILLYPEQVASLFTIKMSSVQYPLVFKSELVTIMAVKEEQLKKHHEVQQAYNKALESVVVKLAKASREEKLKQLEAAHREHFPKYLAAVQAILTDWQKQQFDQLCCKEIKLPDSGFHKEMVLQAIETNLRPKAVPRIMEPYPLAEIVLNNQARRIAGISLSDGLKLTAIATRRIEEECRFYDSLTPVEPSKRDALVQKWYLEWMKSHAKFQQELQAVVGPEAVGRLLNCQLQLRGLTVLADNKIRLQLGMSDEQYAQLSRLNVRKVYEAAVKDKLNKNIVYSRMPEAVEKVWLAHMSEEQQVLWDNLLGRKIESAQLNQMADAIAKSHSERLPPEAFLSHQASK